jgi:hypothetical protein
LNDDELRFKFGLKYRTPAEAAGIEVQGEDKWLTLIQNASQQKTADRKPN